MERTQKEVGRKGQKGYQKVDISFKRKVIREYLTGTLSMSQLGRKYGVDARRIFEWKRWYAKQYGNAVNLPVMTEQEQKELAALKARNRELEQQLKYAQMKQLAYEKMIEIAERELHIDIPKKSGTRQPEQ